MCAPSAGAQPAQAAGALGAGRVRGRWPQARRAGCNLATCAPVHQAQGRWCAGREPRTQAAGALGAGRARAAGARAQSGPAGCDRGRDWNRSRTGCGRKQAN